MVCVLEPCSTSLSLHRQLTVLFPPLYHVSHSLPITSLYFFPIPHVFFSLLTVFTYSLVAGFQAHEWLGATNFNSVRENVKRFTDKGFLVNFSELDITLHKVGGWLLIGWLFGWRFDWLWMSTSVTGPCITVHNVFLTGLRRCASICQRAMCLGATCSLLEVLHIFHQRWQASCVFPNVQYSNCE